MTSALQSFQVELCSFNRAIVVNIAAQRRAQSAPARPVRLLSHCTKTEIVILYCTERRTVFIYPVGALSAHTALICRRTMTKCSRQEMFFRNRFGMEVATMELLFRAQNDRDNNNHLRLTPFVLDWSKAGQTCA